MAGHKTQIWCQVVFLCLASVAVGGHMIAQEGGSACKSLKVNTATYRSPPLTARPGEVNLKDYAAEFPKGHFGIKSLNVEFVYENGDPVPLYDVYNHHWILQELSVPKEDFEKHLQHLLRHKSKHRKFDIPRTSKHHEFVDGSCNRPYGIPWDYVNYQGKGGETRKTESRFPEPYVLESGKEIEGNKTVWILTVHSIDTRGAVNRMGCIECRCDLFNVTTDEEGNPLPEGYLGGSKCCTDGQRCAVEEGFNEEEITFHLQYTFEYIDWNECLIPLSEVTIDITNHDGFCESRELEFTVEGCGDADPNSEECIDTRVATLDSPLGGDFVYVVSHLHATALNASLWGEDGRLICATSPIYGQGHEAGNEEGYVVGVKTCYGSPGTADAVKIKQGEKLKYVVQSTKVGGPHTGLMGILELKIASDGVSAAY